MKIAPIYEGGVSYLYYLLSSIPVWELELFKQVIMNASSNLALLEQFYQSFQNGDAAGMIACYHPAVDFEDPVFGKLHGAEVGQMWTMLLERARGNLDIAYADLKAEAYRGSAYWEARYQFSQTGRQVTNRVNSQFIFEDGKISGQKDSFDFWRWSSMALGLPGKLLGFTPFFRKRIQGRTQTMLKKYMEKNSGSGL